MLGLTLKRLVNLLLLVQGFVGLLAPKTELAKRCTVHDCLGVQRHLGFCVVVSVQLGFESGSLHLALDLVELRLLDQLLSSLADLRGCFVKLFESCSRSLFPFHYILSALADHRLGVPSKTNLDTLLQVNLTLFLRLV